MVGIPPDDAAAVRTILAIADREPAIAELRCRFPWMSLSIAGATLACLDQSCQEKPDVLKGWVRGRWRGVL